MEAPEEEPAEPADPYGLDDDLEAPAPPSGLGALGHQIAVNAEMAACLHDHGHPRLDSQPGVFVDVE